MSHPGKEMGSLEELFVKESAEDVWKDNSANTSPEKTKAYYVTELEAANSLHANFLTDFWFYC